MTGARVQWRVSRGGARGGGGGGGGGVQIHWLVPSYICIYSKAHRDKHKLCIVV